MNTHARIITAISAGLSILFGFILVLLDVTGSLTWSGKLPASSFVVTCTHVGIGFALVGMTLGMLIILRPAKHEVTIKQTSEPARPGRATPKQRKTSGKAPPKQLPLHAIDNEQSKTLLEAFLTMPNLTQTQRQKAEALLSDIAAGTSVSFETISEQLLNNDMLSGSRSDPHYPPRRDTFEFKSVSRSESRNS